MTGGHRIVGVIGVEVAVLFTEIDGGCKASLRSNGNIDVASVASEFGGGGHRAASGVTFNAKKIEAAQQDLRNAVAKVIQAGKS